MAEHLGQVRAERARIEGDIARWEATADELVMKTASSGVAELAGLDDDPGTGPAGTADAVAEWREAVSSGDIATQRAMIKRVFPRLALRLPRTRGDHSPERILETVFGRRFLPKIGVACWDRRVISSV